MEFFTALTYPPILRGFIVLLIAGAFFPLTGVYVLRLNLITLRFMLMHGTLLGGSIALSIGLDPLLLGIAVNILLIVFIAYFVRESKIDIGYITTFFMVLTIGVAVAVMYRAKVPAKDTLEILWGSLFALSMKDVFITFGFSLLSLLFAVLLFRRLKAVLFSREIAFTSGVNVQLFNNAILVVTGLTIAILMKLIGALLIDALLLLPSLIATFFAKSLKAMFILAACLGFASSFCGFILSIALDIPASSAVTITAAVFLCTGFLIRKVVSQ